jgi:hypothetical protein
VHPAIEIKLMQYIKMAKPLPHCIDLPIKDGVDGLE